MHFLKKCPNARNISKSTACISDSATQIAVTASGTPDLQAYYSNYSSCLTKLFLKKKKKKKICAPALSCVITQKGADLVHLTAAVWNHPLNLVMLRLSPLVTLNLITASSQMPYRVFLTPCFTSFLNDTVHMCRAPSLSLIYPSWQIIFGGGH